MNDSALRETAVLLIKERLKAIDWQAFSGCNKPDVLAESVAFAFFEYLAALAINNPQYRQLWHEFLIEALKETIQHKELKK